MEQPPKQETMESRKIEEIGNMLNVMKETSAVKAFLNLSIAAHMDGDLNYSEDWKGVNDALMKHPDVLLFTSLLKLKTVLESYQDHLESFNKGSDSTNPPETTR